MCGIIGYLGTANAIPLLVEGLKRLEYRGYDSAGISWLEQKQNKSRIKVIKREGDVAHLIQHIPADLAAPIGIGHTRWATHGGVTDANAHPHVGPAGKVAVVHNGIFYNHHALRKTLPKNTFSSDTDSEILAHLAEHHLAGGDDPATAVRKTLAQLEGTWGLIFLFAGHPDLLIGACHGSPLIVGIGDGGMFLTSDRAALGQHARQMVRLDDGDIAILSPTAYRTIDANANPVAKTAEDLPAETAAASGKNGHRDFMIKEIHEQPEATARTLGGRLLSEFGTAKLGGLNLERRDIFDIKRIQIMAMGSAHIAGLIGAHLFETLARIPARADNAAELRGRNPIVDKDTLYLALSQSGETIDTLLAAREIRSKGGRVLGVVNVVGSTLARDVDGGAYTHSGPEQAVAATKSFTGQITALTLLALHFARMRDLSLADGRRLVAELANMPDLMQQALACEKDIRALARNLRRAPAFILLGRGISHPVALEGALKLKEIAVRYAEGFSTSEVKHGPIALVGPDTPVIIIAPAGDHLDRTISAMEEIAARKGRVIAITNTKDPRIAKIARTVITVPHTSEPLSPLLTVIPLQLLAYHLGRALKHNVDRPRNLAKCVTVE